MNLEPVLEELVDWRYKSFPAGPPIPIRAVAGQGWNVLDGEFMFPVMVLKEAALHHNIEAMAGFCRRHGVLLAPHGKTAMAPQLFQMQRDAGAWAVTAATTSQVRVWRAVGVDRVLLANELVEPAAIRWIAEEMRRDPAFDFHCLVDSVAGVRWLESGLDAAGLERPLHVLLELGFAGGRTGCRTPEQALEVARAVAGSSCLALSGMEIFEGVIHADGLPATLSAVDRFLGGMRTIVEDLDSAGLFGRVPEVIVSAGGSAFLDRVVADLGASWKLSRPVRLVLRSGCYLTHDAVHYSELSPFGSRLPDTQPLQEALEVWGVVLSLPEPGLALLGFGKRDVSYDLELPLPRFLKSGGEPPRPLLAGA
ncbi:MAG: alanine racemase, partial [Candidatus Dormibacteraeota bacterium]|nr:alanine racemase [Candidatus Dormibacteraeota bacterium]